MAGRRMQLPDAVAAPYQTLVCDVSARRLLLRAVGGVQPQGLLQIILVTGDVTYHSGGQQRRLLPGQHVLVFTATQQPYRWELHAPSQGYGCLFTQDFCLPTRRSPALAIFRAYKSRGLPGMGD